LAEVAVFDELGLAWIRGCMPKTNYQGAILDAIERCLTGSPAILDRTSAAAIPHRHPMRQHQEVFRVTLLPLAIEAFDQPVGGKPRRD
jgi:hypothetical protein